MTLQEGISWEFILSLAAIVSALLVIKKAVDDVKKPFKELSDKVAVLEGQLNEDVKTLQDEISLNNKRIQTEILEIKRKQENDFKMLEEQQRQNRITNKALAALCRHGIDGNNVRQLESIASELDERIYTKSGNL